MVLIEGFLFALVWFLLGGWLFWRVYARHEDATLVKFGKELDSMEKELQELKKEVEEHEPEPSMDPSKLKACPKCHSHLLSISHDVSRRFSEAEKEFFLVDSWMVGCCGCG